MSTDVRNCGAELRNGAACTTRVKHLDYCPSHFLATAMSTADELEEDGARLLLRPLHEWDLSQLLGYGIYASRVSAGEALIES
jgi:hypothetical protein